MKPEVSDWQAVVGRLEKLGSGGTKYWRFVLFPSQKNDNGTRRYASDHPTNHPSGFVPRRLLGGKGRFTRLPAAAFFLYPASEFFLALPRRCGGR